jgi:hypothetical protein
MSSGNPNLRGDLVHIPSSDLLEAKASFRSAPGFLWLYVSSKEGNTL